MELKKAKWEKRDIKEFQDYLLGFKNDNNREWSQNVLNSKLPVLIMKIKDIKYIVHEIYKGNYLSFLDLMIWEYYENTVINGYLINQIEDFDIFKKYLDIYSDLADNWATCDLLKFEISNACEKYFALSNEYVKSNKPFVRRIGLYILFNFLDKKEYIENVFTIIDSFMLEDNYYVNMMNAWLLSECFIKNRERTIKYLENNNLNKFTINKCIQKCRDSLRVEKEDKEMLLKYKVK